MTDFRKFFVIGLLSTAGVPTVLHAQTSDQIAEEAPSGEIVVTAQRRSERLQDIPASISAFSGEALSSAGVPDITSVAIRVPGFYAGGFGTARPQLYIRGIGTRQFDPGSESSVGVFVDESYLGRTGGVLGSLRDIDRVEALKGPQGTLYGRNTIAGAVNVITKAPTSDLSAEFEASYGNLDFTDAFGAVSGPIAGEALKGRLAVWKSDRDGYVTNLTTGKKPQGLDNFGGRLRFEINPSSNVKIDLTGELLRDNGRSFQGQSIGSTANPGGILLGAAAVIGTQRLSSNPFKQFYSVDPVFDRNTEALVGKIDIDLGGASLVSVTSYRHLTYSDLRDFDNTSLDVLTQITAERSKQWTQELRLVSEPDGSLSLGGKVDWILGAFYYKDTSFHSDTFDYGVNSAFGNAPDDITTGNYSTKSIALFGQATIHFGKKLGLTLGGRYTEDKKSADLGGVTGDARPLVAANFLVRNPQTKFNSFDPKVVLSYQPNRDLNFYASWSKGFKSGGYQFTPLTAAQAASVFNPEKLQAYEVGVKSLWLDGALRVNAALFHYDYKDLQVSTIVDLGGGNTPTLIANAGSSTIKGGELEVVLRPSDNWNIGLSYAYTDAKYDRFLGAAGANFANTRLVRAPEHSVSANVDYTLPLSDRNNVVFSANYALISDFFHEPGEARAIYGTTVPLTGEDGYGLLNARVTLNFGDAYAAVWGKNITDKVYRRSVLALPGQVINIYGEPAMYGITVGYRF
jgi:iron complex outermembrane recepter protein